MGKKGSWFSAIKRAFTHNSKEKPSYGSSDKKSSKEKKAGRGVLKHGETKSLIPRFREPSSIEKILGEADELLSRPPTYSEVPKMPPASLLRPASPRARPAASPKAPSPRDIPSSTFSAPSVNASPKVTQSRWGIRYVQRPELSLRNQHRSATMIQAAFRGYLGRRNFRALRGLMRLQGMVRSKNAKRQTMNAMKQMQILVRVQTQIQSRRIQMLENQAYKNDKEVDHTFTKWSLNQLPEASNNKDWDDSVLTKEEEEARLRKKMEAVVKRERAMAYAYSHRLWKANPKAVQSSPVDIRSNGYPWWWNWLERQLPQETTPQSQTATNNPTLTPSRPISEYNPSPQLNASNNRHSNTTRAKQVMTPTMTPSPGPIKNSKPRGNAANNSHYYPLKDDDSLTSCPPLSVRSYMTPTASAKAKARASSNPKERVSGTPVNDSKRRFSFSMTTNMGSFKWNKGSGKESGATQKGLKLNNNISARSIGDLSIDSTVSMPAIVGRKPFNRFV